MSNVMGNMVRKSRLQELAAKRKDQRKRRALMKVRCIIWLSGVRGLSSALENGGFVRRATTESSEQRGSVLDRFEKKHKPPGFAVSKVHWFPTTVQVIPSVFLHAPTHKEQSATRSNASYASSQTDLSREKCNSLIHNQAERIQDISAQLGWKKADSGACFFRRQTLRTS